MVKTRWRDDKNMGGGAGGGRKKETRDREDKVEVNGNGR